MGNAIIGHTGFVGGSLVRQKKFDYCFNRSNIAAIGEQDYDVVICAAAPGRKWLANQSPDLDRECIHMLMNSLRNVKCHKFILISTVDVVNSSVGSTEIDRVCVSDLPPYAKHRRELEVFVEDFFLHHLIVRLPAVVGPGLKKNALFDLHNDHLGFDVDQRGVFQFYPMVNLWWDITRILTLNLKLVHLVSAPISINEICVEVLGRLPPKSVSNGNNPPEYDVRSIYDGLLGGVDGYIYAREIALLAIRSYFQSEPKVSSRC